VNHTNVAIRYRNFDGKTSSELIYRGFSVKKLTNYVKKMSYELGCELICFFGHYKNNKNVTPHFTKNVKTAKKK